MKKTLFKIVGTFILAVALLTTTSTAVMAMTYNGGCTSVGQCVNNKRCETNTDTLGVQSVSPTGEACGSSQLGKVVLPDSIRKMNASASTNVRGIGIFVFINSLVRVFIIICGIWTLFNFLYSGYLLIAAQSDTKVYQEVKDKVTMTMIGLGIIAGAYMIAALIGLIFFGDAGFILNPQLQGALSK
ncbi:hypothetical protein KA082_01670 [Candidatus Woesebacteria bacterium]|nr:hypothetical protein [Candidatus Woesebacteria bacterium]